MKMEFFLRITICVSSNRSIPNFYTGFSRNSKKLSPSKTAVLKAAWVVPFSNSWPIINTVVGLFDWGFPMRLSNTVNSPNYGPTAATMQHRSKKKLRPWQSAGKQIRWLVNTYIQYIYAQNTYLW